MDWFSREGFQEKYLQSLEKINVFRSSFRTLSNIWHGVLCKNSDRLSIVSYFCRKFHLKCLKEFQLHLWFPYITCDMATRTSIVPHCEKGVRIWSFLVRTFPHSDWITRFTKYISIFSPNSGKYGPEKIPMRTLFTQCLFLS